MPAREQKHRIAGQEQRWRRWCWARRQIDDLVCGLATRIWVQVQASLERLDRSEMRMASRVGHGRVRETTSTASLSLDRCLAVRSRRSRVRGPVRAYTPSTWQRNGDASAQGLAKTPQQRPGPGFTPALFALNQCIIFSRAAVHHRSIVHLRLYTHACCTRSHGVA